MAGNVTLRRYLDPIDAQLDRDELEGQGIAALVTEPSTNPLMMGTSGGVHLLVDTEDVDRAEAILRDRVRSPVVDEDPEEEEETRCAARAASSPTAPSSAPSSGACPPAAGRVDLRRRSGRASSAPSASAGAALPQVRARVGRPQRGPPPDDPPPARRSPPRLPPPPRPARRIGLDTPVSSASGSATAWLLAVVIAAVMREGEAPDRRTPSGARGRAGRCSSLRRSPGGCSPASLHPSAPTSARSRSAARCSPRTPRPAPAAGGAWPGGCRQRRSTTRRRAISGASSRRCGPGTRRRPSGRRRRSWAARA